MEVKKIKNILTAIGNPIVNNELNKEKNFIVINNDIQYQEGIFEILEINKKIDFLILSQLIPGNLELEKLIEKIQEIIPKIKIILILEKYNEDLEKTLIKKNIYRILYDNKIEIKDIIKIINEDEKMEKYNEEIRREIDELREYILKNKKYKENNCKKNNLKKQELMNKLKNSKENKIIKINNIKKIIETNQKNNLIKSNKNKKINILKKYRNYIYNITNTIKNIILENKSLNKLFIKKMNKKNLIEDILSIENNNNNSRVISILGNNGSGKSMFCIMLANMLKKYSKKILIIDFDILNNSLHTILGVKKYSEKIKEIINKTNYNYEINIKELIININKKIDLISGINLIFDSISKINEKKVNEIIKALSAYYDTIIIDTTSECFFEYTKEIIKLSKKCIYLTEANLVEISKSKRILEIYRNNWNIESSKIEIIFNKFNKNSIDINLLKKIYSEYKVLGKIEINNTLNLLINKNMKLKKFENHLFEKNEMITNKIS